MIKVTRKQWDSIPKDYKGIWEKWIKENGWQPDLPEEYIGKRTVFEGCITDHASITLLTEGIHFIIVD
jgi:hypothetical protein